MQEEIIAEQHVQIQKYKERINEMTDKTKLLSDELQTAMSGEDQTVTISSLLEKQS